VPYLLQHIIVYTCSTSRRFIMSLHAAVCSSIRTNSKFGITQRHRRRSQHLFIFNFFFLQRPTVVVILMTAQGVGFDFDDIVAGHVILSII
jgi:hypothetical protein